MPSFPQKPVKGQGPSFKDQTRPDVFAEASELEPIDAVGIPEVSSLTHSGSTGIPQIDGSVPMINVDLAPPSVESGNRLAERKRELEHQLDLERQQLEQERQRRLQLEAELRNEPAPGTDRQMNSADEEEPPQLTGNYERSHNTATKLDRRKAGLAVALLWIVMAISLGIWSLTWPAPGPYGAEVAIECRDCVLRNEHKAKSEYRFCPLESPSERCQMEGGFLDFGCGWSAPEVYDKTDCNEDHITPGPWDWSNPNYWNRFFTCVALLVSACLTCILICLIESVCVKNPELAEVNDDVRTPTNDVPTMCGCFSTERVSRKHWIDTCIGVVLLITSCVVLVVAKGRSFPSMVPTPRSDDDTILIQDLINSMTLESQALSYPSEATPGERAVKWLIDDDLSTGATNAHSVLQRYVLVTIWFAIDSFDADGWLTSTDECGWTGVSCVEGKVTSLSFSRHTGSSLFFSRPTGSNGTIPADIGLLTTLTHLSLADNRLVGSIPSQVSSLTDLSSLSLSTNRLTGSLPSQLFSLKALSVLRLSKNRLTGSISSLVGSLTDLSVLDISENQLTGPIPSQIGLLSGLSSLDLSENQFTGSIPIHLGFLLALSALRLFKNQLTGSIPSEISVATHLIGGLNPKPFSVWSDLSELSLFGNQLTGSIPSQLGLMTSLSSLDLGSNLLTGAIPSQLVALTALVNLCLNANRLTGTIPSHLASTTSLALLDVRTNDLNGTMPICDNDARQILTLADCEEVACPCCTVCFVPEQNDSTSVCSDFFSWV